MGDMAKVLIIEDDKSIQKFLNLSLKTKGYDCTIVSTGIDGISLCMTNNPDVILLDLGLPDIEGTTVIEQIRGFSQVPIIVVSARSLEKEKIEALDAGADDYVTKPFHIGELEARIRVSLRKKNVVSEVTDIYDKNGLKIDFEKRKVYAYDTEVHLTPIEYRLLMLLINNSGKVLTHKFINKEIWGYTDTGDSQSLRVFMANIRRKIEKDTASPQFIITEVGVGYRFQE